MCAYLPRSAFFENEQIPFRLKIYNGGIRDLENAEIGIHYFSEFKGYPTTQKPKFSMKDFSTGKSHKNFLSVKLRPGKSCHFQHMFQIKSNNNSTIDNCSFLKNEFQFFVKVFLKGISKPLTFNYPIQISKVLVSLNPNGLEEIDEEPIKKFFVPGQSSFERNPATFKYGPFPVESMFLTMLEIAEQNNPLNYAQ
uniref:Uncharacterized protein n=1 Tax=Panagrolaimus sp. PS1159 TaxID=55785 RepID=A0AC35GPV5_9BILA